MSEETNELMSQKYSTMGDKLLAHMDVLNSIQNEKKFKPITIQMAPVERCTSDCNFCSLAARPLQSYMPFNVMKKCLEDFKSLGAKSTEWTGAGQPDLYYDKENKKNINHALELAAKLNYKIGMITNTETLKRIDKSLFSNIDWIRISLIKIEEKIRAVLIKIRVAFG